MRISLSWLKQYLNFEKSNQDLGDILTDIGLEVEGMDTFESLKGGLKGLVIGKVLSAEKHPDADRLNVTKVDIGTGEILQIVCGAPNVAAGQTVVVAPVGVFVYPIEGEPFEIKKAKIRGVASDGMICAEDEIGLGKSHEGIMVLPNDLKIGIKAADYFGVEEDTILEIGLTPNRCDAYSHIGVARDLRAAINFRETMDLPFILPKIELDKYVSSTQKEISIQIDNKEACPRYSGVLIGNIKVAPSPKWLQNRLNSVGVRPINNIVDITNFVLLEYGQPLHAFDFDKINGNKIMVKNAKEGDKFVTLDKQERVLSDNDLLICDDNGGICLAGIYGGQNSGISDGTQTIFLESAYFTASGIRQSATRLGLKTDASSHFDKGADPNITLIALKRAAQLICEIGGGEIISPFYDEGKNAFDSFEIEISYKRLERIGGVHIPEESVLAILNLLEIGVKTQNNEGLVALVPPFKADVKREIDIFEEILRIYGLNKIPIPKKINASIQFTNGVDNHSLQNGVADFLVSNGFLEIMANSVTKSKHYKGDNQDQLVRLLSSINVELDILRPTMTWSGLEAIGYNVNRKNGNCLFFEFGQVYFKEAEKYLENKQLSIFVTGAKSLSHWDLKEKAADFSYLKSLVDRVLRKLGISGFKLEERENPEFEFGVEYWLGNRQLVSFGKISTALLKQFDIKQAVFHACFNWEILMEIAGKKNVRYKEVPKFPSIKRDLALLINKKITYEQVRQIAEKYGKRNLINIDLFDIFTDEKIGIENKSYAVSFVFQDESKTLVDSEIDLVMNKLMEAYKTQLNAIIR